MAAIVLDGIWVTGGVITDEFRIAMLLTALGFGAADARMLLGRPTRR